MGSGDGEGKFIESENVGRLKVSFFGPFYTTTTSYPSTATTSTHSSWAKTVTTFGSYPARLSARQCQGKIPRHRRVSKYDLERLVWVDHEMEVAERRITYTPLEDPLRAYNKKSASVLSTKARWLFLYPPKKVEKICSAVSLNLSGVKL